MWDSPQGQVYHLNDFLITQVTTTGHYIADGFSKLVQMKGSWIIIHTPTQEDKKKNSRRLKEIDLIGPHHPSNSLVFNWWIERPTDKELLRNSRNHIHEVAEEWRKKWSHLQWSSTWANRGIIHTAKSWKIWSQPCSSGRSCTSRYYNAMTTKIKAKRHQKHLKGYKTNEQEQRW